MTNDERLEALAKAMFDVDYLGWNEETEDGQDDWRRWATAALRHLGCMDGDGEVFVPDVRAAVAGLKRYCWRRCDTEYCAERVENCGVNVALLALTGGSDEG